MAQAIRLGLESRSCFWQREGCSQRSTRGQPLRFLLLRLLLRLLGEEIIKVISAHGEASWTLKLKLSNLDSDRKDYLK